MLGAEVFFVYRPVKIIFQDNKAPILLTTHDAGEAHLTRAAEWFTAVKAN
jgi:hypothetical protein